MFDFQVKGNGTRNLSFANNMLINLEQEGFKVEFYLYYENVKNIFSFRREKKQYNIFIFMRTL